MSKATRYWARGGLVVVGCILALVIGEIGARLLPSVSRYAGDRHPLVLSDPVLHHRYRPNVRVMDGGVEIATNSLGLRDREIERPKPAGVLRVLMLGDSFTQGWGLPAEAAVPAQTGRLLTGRRCDRRIEVVNGGVASYSPILEYLLLRRLAPVLQPDLVVLNFDMTDVHDDWIRSQLARYDRRGLPVAVPADDRREEGLLLLPLSRHTAHGPLAPLQRLLNQSAVFQAFRRTELAHSLFGSRRVTLKRLQALDLVGDVQYDIEGITRDVDTPSIQAGWALTSRYVVAVRDEATAHGAKFALVVYPHAQQVADDESPVGRRLAAIGPGFHDSRRPFEVLEVLGRRDGFPVISLLSLFREHEPTDKPLFKYDDFHHTPRGAALMAQGIVDGLLTHALVPCR